MSLVRPNVVVILADDLGFSDTSPYGGEIPTPNIRALADAGIRFTNYHTGASCAPSRAMLLTGVDSHRNGVPNIPEALPPNQWDQPNYQGTLGLNVVTVASLLKASGYHTYLAGKWHLGRTPELLPTARGFERTFALADTGADNYDHKTYLPIYDGAHWYADGKETTLPDDFYSSKTFVDKTIEFIESNREDGAPFFAYVPFQAVHIPVQAPREFTEKYLGVYDEGWTVLRKRRLESAVAMGIVPEGTALAEIPGTLDWEGLTDEERRYESKKMAVYAGMIDAMDYHIGRLVQYLKDTGQYENTVFVFTSDNGPEASQILGTSYAPMFKGWLSQNGYNWDYETLGERGSYMHIGPSFATAAASPLAYYKFFVHEGGTRVPLIISGASVGRKGEISDALTFVTDLAPTILEMTQTSSPGDTWDGQPVEPMIGKSLISLANGEAEGAHSPDEAIGYELGGNSALYRGDYKIVMDLGPDNDGKAVADGEWHLYNLAIDPGESNDLRDSMPELFASMKADYEAYVKANGVLSVPDGYDQRRQVMSNSARIRRQPKGEE